MSNVTEQIKGKAEVVVGAIETTVGKIVGSEKLEAKGEATEAKGHERVEAAKAGAQVKDPAPVGDKPAKID